MKINFLKLSKKEDNFTGGHIYDKNLFNIISSVPSTQVIESFINHTDNLPKILRPLFATFQGFAKYKSDILIINSASFLRLFPLIVYLSLFSKTKLYSIHHHSIYVEYKGLKRALYKFIEKYSLRSSHRIIVTSPYMLDLLRKEYQENKILNFRTPFSLEKKTQIEPITGNLTFVGTIEPRKGLLYLMKSLKILSVRNVSYNLNIIGKVTNNQYFSLIKSYAEKNDLNVNFLGYISKEEKEEVLSHTDIFTFPSLLEGFGAVLVEAQEYGLPIVSFDNSAMPYTVKNDINGYAVPNLDIEAMADVIENIIKDRELRQRLSAGAFDNLKDQWDQKKLEKTVQSYFYNLSKDL